jgi:murein DD-endopeptidase MepM/ murein hydrolase activator NlpD
MTAGFLTALLAVGWMESVGHAVEEKRLAPSSSSSAEISWTPEAPKQGDVVQLRLIVPDGVHVESGELLSRPLQFYPSPEGAGRWNALFGIDMAQKPGTYELSVRLASDAGEGLRNVTSSIRIRAQAFGEERLNLPDSKVHLSQESLARVKREKATISSLWSAETTEKMWEGPFLIPVEGRPGSPFGLRRWINGERRSSHSGMDIKAPEGRPVKAANHGRVALVGDFFFAGRSVFLDHGQGVYTMYFHLSKIDVEPGQELKKGEVLGLIGMTGRATGPHLHWGVRLGGARVDPASLVERTRAGL